MPILKQGVFKLVKDSIETEIRRLEVLRQLSILDTESEQIYQDAVTLASQICGVPISLISFIDKDRQWFKAKVGIDVTETSLDISVCKYVVSDSAPVIIEDATQDPRVANNPLVTGDLHVRFYAGIPVFAAEQAVGSLCVIGREVNKISENALDSLKALSRFVSSVLELRLRTKAAESETGIVQNALEFAEDSSQLLIQASARFENLFHGLPVACLTLDTEGNIMEWNEMCQTTYGYTAVEALYKNCIDLLIPEENREFAHASFGNTVSTGGHFGPAEYEVQRKNGERIWVLTKSMPLNDREGNVVGMISTNFDITDRKNAEDMLLIKNNVIQEQRNRLEEANTKLATLATTDGLTGIKNHLAFQVQFEKLFAESVKSKAPLALILVDIDHFKLINDDFGHPVGDDVLRQFATCLADCCAKSGFVARYGGEEFAIVLTGDAALKAVELAEVVRTRIERSNWKHRAITASFGVAHFGPGIEDRSTLVLIADAALYRAKREGRNRVQLGSQRLRHAV